MDDDQALMLAAKAWADKHRLDHPTHQVWCHTRFNDVAVQCFTCLDDRRVVTPPSPSTPVE